MPSCVKGTNTVENLLAAHLHDQTCPIQAQAIRVETRLQPVRMDPHANVYLTRASAPIMQQQQRCAGNNEMGFSAQFLGPSLNAYLRIMESDVVVIGQLPFPGDLTGIIDRSIL